MTGSNLTEVELMYLTDFSYIDIPTNVYGCATNFSGIINLMLREDLPKKKRKKLEAIKDYLDENEDSSLGKLTLIKYQNNNPIQNSKHDYSNTTSSSGFVGYAFRDDDGNGIVVYRGSEGFDGDGKLEAEDLANMWSDWGFDSNIGAAVGHEIVQQKEAVAFYDEAMKDITGNKVVTGHSKGGNLAEYVIIHRFDENVYGRTFNGAPYTPPNGNLELEERAKEVLTHPNYLAINIKEDIVCTLGDSKSYRNTKTIAYDGWFPNAFSSHFMENAKIENGEFVTISTNVSQANRPSNISKVKLSNFKNKFNGISKLVTLMGQYSTDLSKEKINSIKASSYKSSDYGELIVDLDELSYYSKRLSSIKNQVDTLSLRLNSIIQQHNLVELKKQYNSVTQINSKLNKSVEYIKDTIELVNEADTAVYNLSKKF